MPKWVEAKACSECGKPLRTAQYRAFDRFPLCADCFHHLVDALALPEWVIKKLGLRRRQVVPK